MQHIYCLANCLGYVVKSKTEGVNVTLATGKCCLPLLLDKLAYASEVRGGLGQKFCPGLFGLDRPTTIHEQILCQLTPLMYIQTHKLLKTPLY